MAAQLIYDDVLVAFNWPGAAAVAVVLLLVLAAILYLAMALGGKTDARNA
jgi:ABC-type spermidine/putrescine transport system permease subunit I